MERESTIHRHHHHTINSNSSTSTAQVPNLSSSSADEIEWIHCNHCFADLWSTLPSNPPSTQFAAAASSPPIGQQPHDQLPTGLSRFAIAQCGHILCVACVFLSYNPQATHLVQCPVCNDIVQYNPLCGEDGLLQSDLSIYFAPLLSQLPPILTALEFRQRNTDSLLRFLKTKLHLQRQAIQKAAKELKSLREVQGQYSAVIRENDTLKSQLKEMQSNLRHHPSSNNIPSHQPPFRMPTAAASAVSRPAFTLPTFKSKTPTSSQRQYPSNSRIFPIPHQTPFPTPFGSLHRPPADSLHSSRVSARSGSTQGSIDEPVLSYSVGARVNSVSLPHTRHPSKGTLATELKRTVSDSASKRVGPLGNQTRKRSQRPGTTIPGRRR